MKSVLFVTQSLDRTGSEVALARLLIGTRLSNVQISVLVWGNVGQLEEDLPKNVSIHKLPFNRLIHNSKIGSMIGRRLMLPVYCNFLLLWKRPSLVYMNTLFVGIGANRFWRRNFRTILHTHELEPMFAGLSEKQTRELIGKPDFVIAASERAAQVFRTLGRTKDMAVIRSPIDFQSLQRLQPAATNRHPARESFTWLMAGSLDANKNPVRFVEIARKYLMKRKHDRFVWLGGQTTGYALYAQSLAKQYGLAGRVDWIQPKDHDDYLSRFAATHGVIITSDVESLSLVAIEALAMGKPVVSFDNGGTKEILNHKHGVLVPKYDIDLCVTKMIAIARGRLRFSPDELKKRAKEFDVSRVKDRWLQILENVGKH